MVARSTVAAVLRRLWRVFALLPVKALQVCAGEDHCMMLVHVWLITMERARAPAVMEGAIEEAQTRHDSIWVRCQHRPEAFECCLVRH